MTDAAILNVTGYAGLTLAMLLDKHPHIRLTAVSGRSDAGKRLRDVFPFWPGPDLPIQADVPSTELVFSALPHAAAAAAILPLHASGSKIVDLSADFRLRDAAVYREWYGEHPEPTMTEASVYGLPEWRRSQIREATLVGNPGCYPTASILAVAPALATGIIEGPIIIDGKSGVSGSGRALTLSNHYSETNESIAAYNVRGHRHAPEIEQELSSLAGKQIEVQFTPHLVPMTRGMLVTCYAPLAGPLTDDDVAQVYHSQYDAEPFVRVVDASPATKWVTGTNLCMVFPSVNKRRTHLTVFAIIDNLVKGAAGQALQNANILFGYEESSGLPTVPTFP